MDRLEEQTEKVFNTLQKNQGFKDLYKQYDKLFCIE